MPRCGVLLGSGTTQPASLLIGKGCDVTVVQSRLRHPSATTTLITDGHPWPDADESSRAAGAAALGAREDSSRTVEADEASDLRVCSDVDPGELGQACFQTLRWQAPRSGCERSGYSRDGVRPCATRSFTMRSGQSSLRVVWRSHVDGPEAVPDSIADRIRRPVCFRCGRRMGAFSEGPERIPVSWRTVRRSACHKGSEWRGGQQLTSGLKSANMPAGLSAQTQAWVR